ncbi:hypothetical protein GN956_G21806 [Arapaima gigas]
MFCPQPLIGALSLSENRGQDDDCVSIFPVFLLSVSLNAWLCKLWISSREDDLPKKLGRYLTAHPFLCSRLGILADSGIGPSPDLSILLHTPRTPRAQTRL